MIQRRAAPRVDTTPAVVPDAARLAFTSYLRVVAMAAVVLVHSLSGLVTNEAIRGSAGWWIGVSLNRGVSWCVPLFIMVSGALLLAPRPGEGAADFYRRRLSRIAIPLVVAHLGYLAVRAFLNHEALTVERVIGDVMTANVYTALYFFWIILGLYLVTPLLRPFMERYGPRGAMVLGTALLAWMWLVSVAVQALILVGRGASPWKPEVLTLWLPYLGYFVLGYALRDLVLGRRGIVTALALFAVAEAATVWQYVTHSDPVNLFLAGGYQGLPVAVSTVALFVIGRSLITPSARLARPAWAGPMRTLGSLTLGVFMGHLLVLRFIWRTPGLTFGVTSSELPVALLAWAIAVVVSFAACALIARVPVARRLIGM
ncbi:MAG TPA: acyltransferase family protein [Candidatus Limnocylindria bacterium]|jgi:surface polysaccharide O-acyltransferase-like enzyme|nr:acyltransferase family protein [Candidatus Limnocylindria bacterium]